MCAWESCVVPASTARSDVSEVDDSRGPARDERLWKAATWSAPLAIQAVIALTAVVAWVLSKVAFTSDDVLASTLLLTATGIAVTVSLAAGGVLLTRRAATERGYGLGLLASAVVVMIGGVGLAFTFFD